MMLLRRVAGSSQQASNPRNSSGLGCAGAWWRQTSAIAISTARWPGMRQMLLAVYKRSGDPSGRSQAMLGSCSLNVKQLSWPGLCPVRGIWRPVRLQEEVLRVDIDSVGWVTTREFRSAARMWNRRYGA